jgi:hypothetical protein
MGCAHRGKKIFTAPAAYRRQVAALSRLPLQPPFLRRIQRLFHIFSASGAKIPAPARKKSQGQNRSVPLRSTTRFFQIIYAALFCAAPTHSIKGRPQSRDKKARPRLHVKSTVKEKHGNHSQRHYPQPCPASYRSGSGKKG